MILYDGLPGSGCQVSRGESLSSLVGQGLYYTQFQAESLSELSHRSPSWNAGWVKMVIQVSLWQKWVMVDSSYDARVVFQQCKSPQNTVVPGE